MVKNNNITKLSPLNIDYDIMENYWQEDFRFLIENIILDKQYYLLYSPLNILKKIKELKRIKKKSKKSSRNIKREEDNINYKIIERIDKIYKQIIK